MKYFMGFVLLFFLAGCSSKEDFVLFYNDLETDSTVDVDKDEAVNTIPIESVKFEYKIMPYDRVSLIIYKHPEFSTTKIGAASEDKGIIVDSDGDLSLPLVDAIHVAGLTQKEARIKIEDAFSSYLKYSKVKLEVLNKRVYVMGEVKKPGEFELFNEKSSLLKMLAKAGDLTDFANRKNIFIIREQYGKTTIKRVNLVDLHAIKYAGLQILPNDIIYVAPKGMKASSFKLKNQYSPIFSLIGQVLSPFVSIKYLADR